VLQRKTAAVWNGREASTGLLNRIVGVQCCLRGVVVKRGHQGLVQVGKGEYGFLEDVWVLQKQGCKKGGSEVSRWCFKHGSSIAVSLAWSLFPERLSRLRAGREGLISFP
jgi:hypothetical protein